MEGFKLFGGKQIPDLGVYVKDYILKHPEVEIYIGTDSKNKRKHTTFASVVCFLHPSKGVHIIFKRTRVKKIKRNRSDYVEVKDSSDAAFIKKYWKSTLFPRMWAEVQDSAELALYLKDYVLNREIIVDLDLNPDKLHESNIAHDSGMGYMTSLGFKTRSKPDSWASSSAADLLCR